MWDYKKRNERISHSNGTHITTCEPNFWDRTHGAKILGVVGVWGHQCRWKWTTTLSWCQCCIQACSTKCNWLPLKIWLLKGTGIKTLPENLLVTEYSREQITLTFRNCWYKHYAGAIRFIFYFRAVHAKEGFQELLMPPMLLPPLPSQQLFLTRY